MNRICIFLIAVMAFSCTGTGQREQPEIEVVEEKKLGKLERLLLLPRDSVLDYYDLLNYTHIKEDQPWSVGEEKTVYERFTEPPPHIKSYMFNVLAEGDNFSYKSLLYTSKLADSQCYKNELNAYMKEQQLFKNLLYNEQTDLEYRIWLYSSLANLSDKY